MEINKILYDAGLKCTKQRISVMESLLCAKAPMTAENIYESVDGMSLSTVYRIVERLCEKGIVRKNTIQDSDKFYYELTSGGHRHYAICLGCKSMKYVDICPVNAPHIDNFTVTGHKLEIYGYCDECKNKGH
ncbi:MAG: transcriptional repressor [Oscillospiraceae bacterium]|nr:transcriptional repressor [Oscillospiraceae bacterium]